jgi:outer membrane lipoprotein-sorting protein
MRNHTGARRSLQRRSAVVTLALAVSGVAFLIAEQRPAGDDVSFDELFRRGSEINAELKTLTARFTETTTSSILVRPLDDSGPGAAQRPSRVVLHYEHPESRDLLIDGDRLTLSWPGRNIREVTNIAAANRRIQRYFVDRSPAELRESFDIVTGEAADRPGTYKLTMLPRRNQIREGLSRLELWLDKSSLLLAAMRMTFPNGDTKLMLLEDVRVNVPIDPGAFALAPSPAPLR